MTHSRDKKMAAPLLNFNVGVLGHVDSGKTSLSKALSTVASTASFDKNPQSKERGITLDLGFSSFQVDAPSQLAVETVQYTLVDCPGHASLIKTIIGGAQIIDLMVLVVDVVKGMQTQTAECLVIGEITCQKMIVVLNKIDLLPNDKKEQMIDRMKKKMLKTLESTRFSGCPVVAVAAKPGGPEAPDTGAVGLDDLIETLKTNTYIPNRDTRGPFIFSVDHCFSIRGQGTVMTGTALSGSAAINDTIEIPSMKVSKKVKSMQMFKKPVEKVIQGDRAGICVTQFDPKLLERGTICTPGALPTIEAGIISVFKIPYYKGSVLTKAKFHITTGHDTVMGRLTFFGLYDDKPAKSETALESGASKLTIAENDVVDYTREYLFQDELMSPEAKKNSASGDVTEKYSFPVKQFALVQFEKPIVCQNHCLVIGSKLDTDIHANICRIAFHGKLLDSFTDSKYVTNVLPKLKVYKTKVREGLVERATSAHEVIGKNLFKKETNIEAFSGLKVTLSTGQKGTILGGFGQSGKVKIQMTDQLPEEIVQRYSKTKRKGKEAAEKVTNHEEGDTDHQPNKIFLSFKRYVYDPDKKMKQT